jgi:hypothetical protein
VRRRLSTFALLLFLPTAVLWAWSYHRPLVWQPASVPGWRVACDRGSLLVDDEPAIADARAVRSQLLYAHNRYSRWRFDAMLKAMQQAHPRDPKKYTDRIREVALRDQQTDRALRPLPATPRLNMPSLGFLAFTFALSASPPLVHKLRARFRRKEGLCPRCSYDLTGNTSGVCPECGRPISALHPLWSPGIRHRRLSSDAIRVNFPHPLPNG